MPSTINSFNLIFIRRLTQLVHIFLPLSRLSVNVHHNYRERIYLHPLVLILLLLANEGTLQYIIYLVGLVPSSYYSALGKPPNERDFGAFRWLVLRSFSLIIANALLKSSSDFLSSLLYVQWRMRLVVHLHSFYFTQKRYYHLLNAKQEIEHLSDHSIQT
jgi:ABC-type uncharacterized transport system fused permease/ATPase subunit